MSQTIQTFKVAELKIDIKINSWFFWGESLSLKKSLLTKTKKLFTKSSYKLTYTLSQKLLEVDKTRDVTKCDLIPPLAL